MRFSVASCIETPSAYAPDRLVSTVRLQYLWFLVVGLVNCHLDSALI
jgi:hypothetical protein